MLITPTKEKNNRLRRRLITATASQINGLVHLRGERIGTIVLGLRRRPKPLLLASPNEDAHQQHPTRQSDSCVQRGSRTAVHNEAVGQLRTTRLSDSCVQRGSRTAAYNEAVGQLRTNKKRMAYATLFIFYGKLVRTRLYRQTTSPQKQLLIPTYPFR